MISRCADDGAPRRHERGGKHVRRRSRPSLRCCAGDEGRPLGAVWPEEAPTHRTRRWSQARGVSVAEQAGQHPSGGGHGDDPPCTAANVSKASGRHRHQGGVGHLGDAARGPCVLARGWPAGGRRARAPGCCVARGHLAPRGAGSAARGRPTSRGVPRRGAGTAPGVGARTPRSWRGREGPGALRCRHRSTRTGRRRWTTPRRLCCPRPRGGGQRRRSTPTRERRAWTPRRGPPVRGTARALWRSGGTGGRRGVTGPRRAARAADRTAGQADAGCRRLGTAWPQSP